MGGHHDACQGDSGGPLVAYKPDGTPVLIGITSFGNGAGDDNADPHCGRPMSGGFYARVAGFVVWIRARGDPSMMPPASAPRPPSPPPPMDTCTLATAHTEGGCNLDYISGLNKQIYDMLRWGHWARPVVHARQVLQRGVDPPPGELYFGELSPDQAECQPGGYGATITGGCDASTYRSFSLAHGGKMARSTKLVKIIPSVDARLRSATNTKSMENPSPLPIKIRAAS